MRYVYHNTQPVHFRYHFFTERTQAAPFRFAAGRVAYIVAAVVAERDVADSQLFETGNVTKILTNGVPVFYSEHDRFLPGIFRYPHFLRSMGNVHPAPVYLHLAVNLIQPVYGEIRSLVQ